MDCFKLNLTVLHYIRSTQETGNSSNSLAISESLCVNLDNDQRDSHLLYFTIYLLHFSTCFEHYMLIIRRLNCIDAASDIVLSVSGRLVHRLGEN